MSFRPEMQKAVNHYAAMSSEQSQREIRAMTEIRAAFDHCLAAAKRAENQERRKRK